MALVSFLNQLACRGNYFSGSCLGTNSMSSQEASVWLTNLKEGKVRERRVNEREKEEEDE